MGGWQGSLSAVWLRAGYLSRKCSPVQMLRKARTRKVLAEGRHDFRGLAYQPGQMADCGLVDYELQEWHQQLRNWTRPEYFSEVSLAHASPHPIRDAR